MTVSLPVIEFAKEWNVSQDKLYRALVVSNLIAVHQKKYIGSLSAYCGAVSAGCGAGAAITYLSGGSYEDVSLTIVNTIGTSAVSSATEQNPPVQQKSHPLLMPQFWLITWASITEASSRARVSCGKMSKIRLRVWDTSEESA